MSRPHVVIMAGGTGGHVFPALAVAGLLQQQGAEVSWLGSQNGMEGALVEPAGIPIRYISIAGLRGNGALGWLLAPLRVARAVAQAVGILRQVRPTAVLGMGGFVTGPGGLAARLLGTPLLIHEQNAVAGLSNRLLAPLASCRMEAFPGTFDRSAVLTGNPVRPAITGLSPPEVRFAGRTGPLRLLVLGGSQGAVAINERLPGALAALPPTGRPAVRHQSGQRNLEATRRAYADAQVEATVSAFIEDMAEAYGWADLVICRAGALTVSELAAAGVGALLVPFPFAVDDHQTLNARYLTAADAAELAPQAELTEARLAARIAHFCADAERGREQLLAMARRARSLARPAAGDEVARLCLDLATGGEQ